MVRTYQRKTNRKVISPRKLVEAVKLVRSGYAIRTIAKQKGINRQTLWKAVKRTNNRDEVDDKCKELQLSYSKRSIFTNKMEDQIVKYCIDMAQMGFGLTVNKVREIAYETAIKNKLSVPIIWKQNKVAGVDWFKGKGSYLGLLFSCTKQSWQQSWFLKLMHMIV